MNEFRHINIALQAFAILISLFIMIIMLTDGFGRNDRRNRLFMRLMFCNLGVLVIDTFAWFFDGAAFRHAAAAVRACKFMSYSLSYLLIPLFTDYLVAMIGAPDRFLKAVSRGMYVAFAAVVALIAVSNFNQMFYYYDAGNAYQSGAYFWLSQVVGILLLLAAVAVFFAYRKRLYRHDVFFILLYGAFPILAMVLQALFFQELELLFVATTLTIVAYYAGIQVRQSRLLQEKEQELANARVDVMLSQIQPHFLYNSLAVIRHLCKSDPNLAADTVLEFSDYLRGNMDSLKLKAPIAFERELRHVETYLSIEKKRFGDKLNIVYDINFVDFTLPALTLQPIVENAVRYGVTKRERGGTVTIRAEESAGRAVITVTDDGVGFDPNRPAQDDGRSHVGIVSVRNRLTAMCGGAFEIKSHPDEGTTAVITVPVS